MVEITLDTYPMSKDEVIENLKRMVFGAQAFERFNAVERHTISKAVDMLEESKLVRKVNCFSSQKASLTN